MGAWPRCAAQRLVSSASVIIVIIKRFILCSSKSHFQLADRSRPVEQFVIGAPVPSCLPSAADSSLQWSSVARLSLNASRAWQVALDASPVASATLRKLRTLQLASGVSTVMHPAYHRRWDENAEFTAGTALPTVKLLLAGGKGCQYAGPSKAKANGTHSYSSTR